MSLKNHLSQWWKKDRCKGRKKSSLERPQSKKAPKSPEFIETDDSSDDDEQKPKKSPKSSEEEEEEEPKT